MRMKKIQQNYNLTDTNEMPSWYTVLAFVMLSPDSVQV